VRLKMARTVEVPEYEVHDRVSVDPSRAALLVIDMQNDFVKEGGALGVPDAAATIPRIARLVDRARAAGIRVAFSQDTHDDDDPEWRIWGEHVRRGSTTCGRTAPSATSHPRSSRLYTHRRTRRVHLVIRFRKATITVSVEPGPFKNQLAG
jgi:isochorismate hydrolase